MREELVERVAAACCNDILARDVADKQCAPSFENSDPETQDFWRHIARAALIQSDAARIERLEKALEPFAEAADNLTGDEPDQASLWETPEAMMLEYRHLREARAALSSESTS